MNRILYSPGLLLLHVVKPVGDEDIEVPGTHALKSIGEFPLLAALPLASYSNFCFIELGILLTSDTSSCMQSLRAVIAHMWIVNGFH